MSDLKNEHVMDTSTLQRRDLLRGAAALVAVVFHLRQRRLRQRKRSERPSPSTRNGFLAFAPRTFRPTAR